MTSRWLPKPTLHGDLVTLRPFAADDADAMAAIFADPEVLRLTGSVTSTAQIAAATGEPDEPTRQWYATRAQADERLDLAIIDNRSGAVVGEVVLNEFDGETNSANFRTLMGPAGRGRGLGTQAARLIVGYGFEAIGLHRISLDVFAFNPRAQHVYANVGFVVEGVKRDGFRFDGEYVDEVWMAILDREWMVHRGWPARATGRVQDSTMNYYLVSFPSAAMQVTAEELPEVAQAARAVVRRAKEAGVFVFGGGINEAVPPVMVAGDGGVTEQTYPQSKELEGGYTVLKCASREEAIAWAAEIAEACRCSQEVREFQYDPESAGGVS